MEIAGCVGKQRVQHKEDGNEWSTAAKPMDISQMVLRDCGDHGDGEKQCSVKPQTMSWFSSW